MNPGDLEFSGNLSDFHLIEVLQFLSLSRKSGEVEILDDSRFPVGSVFIQDGSIVHAVMNGSRSVFAFDHILAMTHGFFRFVNGRGVAERTIDLPTEVLLLDAHHRLDELRRLRSLLPGDETVLAIRTDVDPVPPLNTRQWRVMALVNGRRTIGRICSNLGDELAARQLLLELIGLRLVAPQSRESPLMALVPLPRSTHTVSGERAYPPRLRTNLLVKAIDGRTTVRELLDRLNMPPEEIIEDLALLLELQWILFSGEEGAAFRGVLQEAGLGISGCRE